MDLNKKTFKKSIPIIIGYIIFSIVFGLFSSKIDYGFSPSSPELLAILFLVALFFGSVLWTLFTVIFVVLSIITKKMQKIRKNIILIFFICWLMTIPIFISYKFFSIAVGQKTKDSGELILKNLEEYKKDNGNYPDNLTTLIPRYLTEIPKTGKGKEFIYQSDGGSYYLYFNEDFGRIDYDAKTKEWTYHD